MDIKVLFTVFATVFLAELADKTQFTVMMFASEKPGQGWAVFVGSSLALLLATSIGVAAGGWIAQHVNTRYMMIAAGVVFVLVGLWTVRSAYVS